MRTIQLLAAHLTLSSAATCLLAQPAEDAGRVFCDAEAPGNGDCPGPRCECAPDTLEITFDGKQPSSFEYITFVPETSIEATVVLDTKSPQIWGWTYGVEHDADFLTLRSVRFDGTDAEAQLAGGFEQTEMLDIETCEGDPRCSMPRPGSGFVSAVILSFGQPAQLRLQRNSLAAAVYSFHANPGPAGTRIEFVEHLRTRDSVATDINLVIRGLGAKPARIVDGILRQIVDGAGGQFRRGDADGDGRWSVQDAIAIIYTWLGAVEPPLDCDDALDADDNGRRSVLDAIPILAHVFQRGPGLPPPFRDCGVDPTVDALDCAEVACP